MELLPSFLTVLARVNRDRVFCDMKLVKFSNPSFFRVHWVTSIQHGCPQRKKNKVKAGAVGGVNQDKKYVVVFAPSKPVKILNSIHGCIYILIYAYPLHLHSRINRETRPALRKHKLQDFPRNEIPKNVLHGKEATIFSNNAPYKLFLKNVKIKIKIKKPPRYSYWMCE